MVCHHGHGQYWAIRAGQMCPCPEYGGLASRWSMLGQEALPREVPAFRQTGELLRKKHDLYERKGAKASQPMRDAAEKLRALEKQMRESFPFIQQDTA